MTLVIDLPPQLEEKLQQRAAEAGKDAATFAREALEEKLLGPQALDEILAPFRRRSLKAG